MTDPDRAALWTAEDVMGYLKCSRRFVQAHKAELGVRQSGRLLRFDPAIVTAFGRPATVEPRPTEIERERSARRPALKHASAVNPVSGRAWKGAAQ